MSHNLPRTKVIYHVDKIDCTVAGPIDIVTLPNQKFYTTNTIIEVISTNALSSVPKISIGAHPNCNNIINDLEALNGLMNANQTKHYVGSAGYSIQPGSRICFKVIEPAQGGAGITYIVKVILIGALI